MIAEMLPIYENLCTSVADVIWKFLLLRVAAVQAVMLFESCCYCQHIFQVELVADNFIHNASCSFLSPSIMLLNCNFFLCR